MLRRAAKQIALRLLTPKPRPPYEEVWHLWTVLVPRRSITGRLLRGTVLRRQHDGRWIYKQYIEIVHGAEFGRAAVIPLSEPALVDNPTAALAGEGKELLVSQRAENAPTPLPSLTRAQKIALAVLGAFILLPAAIEYHHIQTGAPTVGCDYDEHCGVLDTTAPTPDSDKVQPNTKDAIVVVPRPSLDSNGNESGVVISSKTGARARVGVRYAKRFQAYVNDLENNYGARVLFMGGIRRGHCSSSSQHPCGKALDVCQLRRGVVDPRCRLPARAALAQIAASHGLFEGGRWCNSDYGHAQVDTTASACGDRRAHTARRHRTRPAALAEVAPPM